VEGIVCDAHATPKFSQFLHSGRLQQIFAVVPRTTAVAKIVLVAKNGGFVLCFSLSCPLQ
jgi:hypothetical protein